MITNKIDINTSIRKHRENTDILNLQEIDSISEKKGNGFFPIKVPFSKLNEIETECIPIAHYYDDEKKLQVVFSKEPSHCLAIGCTGAGKTTSLAIPKVRILSKLKNKPSFFIVDVKGELQENLSGSLKKEGYDVQVIDLNEPEYSLSWNPFSQLYDNYIAAHKLVENVIEHEDSIDNYKHLKKMEFGKKHECWYEFDGLAFTSLELLNSAIAMKREKLLTDTSAEVRDLAYMFIKSNGLDDPHWDDSARDIFTGVVLGMLERTVLEEPKALKKDQFNLKNIIDILLTSTSERLSRFIKNCERDGEAYRYAHRLITLEAEKTRSCYFGVLSAQLTAFKSYAIQKITLNNSVDLSNISEKPMAIFLKMDDMKEASYSIVQLIVLRLYQQLSTKCLKLPRNRLTRPVHFILDEFGNFPPFKNFNNMISESRGKNIWYTMIIQSYRQLDIKYGEQFAKVIVENCNMQMFFGSNDYKTKREFSDACGQTTYISERAYLDGDSSNIKVFPIENYNTVTVSDLARINQSEVYIIALGMPVLHSRMERYFLTKEMKPLPPEEYRVITNIEMNSKQYTYDIVNDTPVINSKIYFDKVYNPKPVEENEEEPPEIDAYSMFIWYLSKETPLENERYLYVSQALEEILPDFFCEAFQKFIDGTYKVDMKKTKALFKEIDEKYYKKLEEKYKNKFFGAMYKKLHDIYNGTLFETDYDRFISRAKIKLLATCRRYGEILPRKIVDMIKESALLLDNLTKEEYLIYMILAEDFD